MMLTLSMSHITLMRTVVWKYIMKITHGELLTEIWLSSGYFCKWYIDMTSLT